MSCFSKIGGRLALDLGIGEDEGHALALDARADAQGLQVLEERVVVVGLRNGDPQPVIASG